MKFRNLLIRRSLIQVLIIIVCLTLIFFFAFSNLFSNYVIQNRQDQFQYLMSSIIKLVERKNLRLTSQVLDSMLSEWDIDLVVYDQNEDIIGSYSGLNPHSGQRTYSYKYTIQNTRYSDGPATIVVKADVDSRLTLNTIKHFQIRTLLILLVSGAAAFVISILTGKRFADSITNPIAQLNKSTRLLRHHHYDVEIPQSQVTEINQLGESYEYLAQELADQEQSRQNYADNIAHELRTPLTNIFMQIEGMKMEVYPLDQENLAKIQHSAEQLASIVERLDFTFENEDRAGAVKIQDVPISDLTNKILDTFKPSMEKANGRFIRKIEEDLIFPTDPNLYSEILENLLTNAIKAFNKEKNLIRVELRIDQDGKLLMSVSDNGVGIKEKDQEQIFHRFYRVDSSRNRKTGGQGLGLAITKNLANKLGGTLDVSSKFGEGSTFLVVINKPPKEETKKEESK